MNTLIHESSIISSQGQITLPVKVRKALNLKSGDVISWLVVKANDGYKQLVALRQPKDWVEATYGIAKKHYAKYGGAEKYLKREKESWD